LDEDYFFRLMFQITAVGATYDGLAPNTLADPMIQLSRPAIWRRARGVACGRLGVPAPRDLSVNPTGLNLVTFDRQQFKLRLAVDTSICINQ
jgi:hypothetical protein